MNTVKSGSLSQCLHSRVQYFGLTPKCRIPLQGSVFMESSWLLCWSCWNILNNFFCNKCVFRSGEFASFPMQRKHICLFLLLNYFLLLRENSTEISLSFLVVSIFEICLSLGMYLFLFSHCDYFVLVIHFSAAVVSFRVVSELLIRQLCFLLSWFP